MTKLTTITVQADDDWIIAVKIIPTSIPVKRLVVKNSKMPLNLAPAAFSIASLMVCIPNRNKPSPPAIDNKMELLIILPIPYIYFTLLIIKYVKTRYNIYF